MRCIIGLAILALGAGVIGLGVRADDAKVNKSEVPTTAQCASAGEITAVLQSAKKSASGGTVTVRVEGVTTQGSGGRRSMPRTKETHQDYVFDLTSDAKIRMLHLPPLTDENGKKVNRTPEELQKLKGNSTLPGYQAEISDLKPNQVVTIYLGKLRGAKGDDAKKSYVTRVTIVSEPESNPNLKPPDKKGK
jgi:hypothetical protein